ncbi:MAG: hypothetical protein FWF42_03855 [Streptococcaceae bacterium]|nr:hypothetical protein [Streptococcaceae bacterium]
MNTKEKRARKLLGVIMLVAVFTIYNTGCTNSGQSKASKDTGSERVLPAGWHIGEKHSFEGRNQVEKNMLSQIMTYNSALLVGDISNARKYVYQDAITYYKRFYPTVVPDERVLSDFFKIFSNDYIASMNTYREHGIDVNIIPTNIQRQVTFGNSIIIVFDIVSMMTDGNTPIYSDSETSIGISLNNGKNWSFLTLMEEVPNILRMRFNERIVNEVMGY